MAVTIHCDHSRLISASRAAQYAIENSEFSDGFAIIEAIEHDDKEVWIVKKVKSGYVVRPAE